MSSYDEGLIDHLLTLRHWTDQTGRVVRDVPYERFRGDLIGQLALCKAIEQCGEISIRIIKRWPEFVAANPQIEFRQAQATRHRIAHAYENLDLDLIWVTATTSIPQMGEALKQAMSRIALDEQP